MVVAALAAIMHFGGALLLRIVAPRTPLSLASVTGFAWGMFAFELTALAILSAGIPYNAMTVAIGSSVIWLLILAIAAARRALASDALRQLLLSSVAVFVLAWVAGLFSYRFLTMDSSALILVGRSLALHGGFDVALAGEASVDFGWLNNHGAMIPLLQSTALFLGLDFHPTLAPLTAASLIAAFLWFCAYRAHVGVNGRPYVLPAIAVTAVFSSYFVALHAFYVHNNLAAALYLFLAVIGVWRAIVERETHWLALTTLALLAFSLTRLDTFVMSLLLVIFVASRQEFTSAAKSRFAAWYCLPMILWHLQLWRITTDSAAVMPPGRALLIVAGLCLTMVIVFLGRLSFVDRLLREAPFLALAALFAALAAIAFREPGEVASSMDGFLRNLTSQGSWAALWVGIGVLAALAARAAPLSGEAVFAYVLAAYLPLLQILAVMRHAPFRLGWSDSGNRMFLPAAPILLFWLLARLMSDERRSAAPIVGSRLNRGFTQTLAGVTGLVLLTMSATPARDVAIRAAALEGPACVDGYGVVVAVDPRASSSAFVSATERCPSTAIFDFGAVRPVDMIELGRHDILRRFLDYAWSVSSDGRHWKVAFDSRRGGIAQAANDDRAFYDLRHIAGDARYLRLSLRAAAQENRLLMNKLSVWTRWAPPRGAAPLDEAIWTPYDALAHVADFVQPLVDERGAFDAAVGAVMVDGPTFAPGQDISLALRGFTDDRFALAASMPNTFTLDLGWTVVANAVELWSPTPESRWTDFSLAASLDGASLTVLFDSDKDAERLSADGAHVLAEFTAPAKLRFIRVEHRASADGGPLRLSRLVVETRLRPALEPPDSEVARRLGNRLDLAIGAEVVKSPECAPGFGPGVLLRGVSDARFMSAVERCPSELTLDLGAEISATNLRLDEHDPQRGLSDYAWEVSSDGENWRTVFDSKRDVEPTRAAPNVIVYSLRDSGTFRRVRLVARAAKGENRLLLSRIAITRD